MTTSRRVLFASASAVALAIGFASQASAQTVYGGGASLPSVALRELFNCWGGDIRTTTDPFFDPARCTTPPNPASFKPRFTYATTGSGGGLRAYALRDPSQLGTVGSTSVPYADNGSPTPNPLTGITYPFPTHQYSSSESPLFPVNYPHPVLPGVIINNSANQTLNCFYGDAAATGGACTVDQRVATGEAMVLPNLSSTVGIVANFNNVAKTIKLSRTSFCGIFTGGITNWNDPQITADNGGVSVSGGINRTIQPVVRADGSGTSFLFTQALEAQCTPAKTASATYPAGFDYTGGVSTQPTWPVGFWRAPQNNGVAATIDDTPWAVGYLSPDFHQPQVTTIDAPSTFNVVNGTGVVQKTVVAGTYDAYLPARLQNKAGGYKVPSPYGATQAMASATAPAPGAARLNPVNWFNGALIPDPAGADAYPMSGFNWFLNYTCYNNTGSNANVASRLRQYLTWFLVSTGDPKTILNANGFGVLPANILGAVKNHAINTAASRLSIVGSGATNTVCVAKTGA